jgi:hypothetical protein
MSNPLKLKLFYIDSQLEGSILRFLLYGWYVGPIVFICMIPIYIVSIPVWILRTMSFKHGGGCNDLFFRIWVRRGFGAYNPKK